MAKSPAPTPKAPGQLEKSLAYMAAGVIGLSILSILGIVFLAALGQGQLIAWVVGIPMIGLPAGALLILVLVAVRIRGNRSSR